MAQSSDRDLVLSVRRGNTEAFGVLVERYQQSIYNVCYRMLHERRDAEDLAQEAFVRAFQRLETFDAERPFGPWMRRLATNVCLNHLQRKRHILIELEEERQLPQESGPAGPEKAQVQRERAEEVREAITDLPAHYRAVVELRHFQEMSYAEIAESLDIPLSDVKSHLFRARKKLADELAGS